jgi:hypothetical protein
LKRSNQLGVRKTWPLMRTIRYRKFSRRCCRDPRLREAGIFARPGISLEYQQLAKRYVVRGVESGGAIDNLGHYDTFCGESRLLTRECWTLLMSQRHHWIDRGRGPLRDVAAKQSYGPINK